MLNASCFLVCALLSVSCVTFTRPEAKLTQNPISLPLTEDNFADANIDFRCFRGDSDTKEITAANIPICRSLARHFTAFGANTTISGEALDTPADEEKEEDADPPSAATPSPAPASPKMNLVVEYVDWSGDRDYCGWTLPFFIIGLGLYFPCVEDIHTRGEVRIYGPAQEILHKSDYNIALRKIYGAPSLLFMLLRLRSSPTNDSIAQKAKRNFYRHVINETQSGYLAVKRRLESSANLAKNSGGSL
ncbi:MAG: hypothetical protein AB7T49_13215 [Oligoflexales bacterium]